TLDKDLCKGCTNCVKRCPTEAIRVRNGKAIIIKERCIDCGECIRVCPQHAKKAIVDPLGVLSNYRYTVALPAPTLYAQFKKLDSIDLLLTALLRIGFDDVFEVAVAAEVVSAETRRMLATENLPLPVISSACPAVLRIIRVRFPELIPNVLELRSPMEFSARWAKQRAAKRTGLDPKEIGCIFISPCPAKVTSMKMPLGTEESCVDAVVSIAEIYPKLRAALKKLSSEPISHAGALGIGWATAGGECAGIKKPDYLAADGIENVIRVLEALEDDKINDVEFVELNACVGGCVGGVLTVESPFIARARLKRLIDKRAALPPPEPLEPPPGDLHWDYDITYEPVMRLDDDITTAMQKLARIQELEAGFNGMDCGACGAPSCRALAEDIVGGYA
ncbi:MAG: [Fe-Fe] hydrogenase large subunit C-terminal domain-containing protein, partial [Oscillospiraceae bacterium]